MPAGCFDHARLIVDSIADKVSNNYAKLLCGTITKVKGEIKISIFEEHLCRNIDPRDFPSDRQALLKIDNYSLTSGAIILPELEI